MDSFNLLICPKGTILKKKWRTGYYHIAKELNVPILVGGMDYNLKKVVLFDIEQHDSIENTERSVKLQLANIVPLYPECEVVDIRDHSYRSIASYTHFLGILILFFIIPMIIPMIITLIF